MDQGIKQEDLLRSLVNEGKAATQAMAPIARLAKSLLQVMTTKISGAPNCIVLFIERRKSQQE